MVDTRNSRTLRLARGLSASLVLTLTLTLALALASTACGDAGEIVDEEEEVPQVEASAKGDLQWKRAHALERDLMAALDLAQDEVCVEVGVEPCIQGVHLVALGAHDPIDLGLYRSLDEPLTTTPIALDRVVLSACIARVSADEALGDEALVFGALDLEADAPEPTSEAVGALAQALTRRLFARDPLPREVEILGQLSVDEAGAPVSATDFATLACYSLGTTSEFLMF